MTSVDRTLIIPIKMQQLSLYKQEIPLKDEIHPTVLDLDPPSLNSLLLGRTLDALSLGIQVMFLSLEKKLLEP